MERAEEVTHQRLMHIHRTIVLTALAHRDGSIVKHTGDGFLATFKSAVLATCCALEIQEKVAEVNADASAADAILFRMGVNLADVIVESHDVFGDGVNVAARLQTYAEPGGLIVSGIVAEAILGQVPANITSVGDFYPKNLSRPIEAFSVHAHGAPTVVPVNVQQNWERPSIAVLPFQYVGDDPEYAYFAEGLIEGIIHPLSGLDGLLVISQHSTHAYAGKRPDVRRVGRDLGVRYVLSGTLYRFGAKLRILTQLTDAETGAIVSTDRQEGSLSDLFELQDRISAHAVATIAPHIRDWELQRVRRKPADSLTAYELMLRAGDLMLRLNETDFNRSRGLLQQAIAEDPGYAPAWAHAAYWHILRIGQGWTPDVSADRAESLRCAAAALERDEDYSLALAIRGHIKSFLERDFVGATVLLERALATGPNVALAWSFASATSGYLGDGPTAVLRAERAIRISPRDPYAFRHEHMLSQAHYINSNFEEAVAWGERAAERNGRMTSNLRTLCAALVAAGKLERARAVARDLLAVEPTFRLTSWSRRTPLSGAILEGFAARLREAGLQD
jgi:adenylate cyclase